MNSDWFTILKTTPRARGTLVCFHFGGGSSISFRPWLQFLPPGINLVGVDLPGRGMRFAEPVLKNCGAVISRLLDNSHFLDIFSPCVFFGHSLGALIAYEYVRALEKESIQSPVHLFVSGRNGPGEPRETDPIHALPEDQFIERLRDYQGTPQEVLENRELMDIFLPALRADFSISETFQLPANARPINTDITAFTGSKDKTIKPDNLSSWRRYTHGKFESITYSGGHFFINDHADDIVRRMTTMLENKRFST